MIKKTLIYHRNERLRGHRNVLLALSVIFPGILMLFGCAGVTPDLDERSKPDVQQYQPGDVFQDCPKCPEMVVIPQGRFVIGNESALGNKPREVIISQKIAFATTETTVDAYRLFHEAIKREDARNVSDSKDGDKPVVEVSWFDATEYARWLTEKTGVRYRLPTEEEWEYAARAGTTTRYWWGDSWRDHPDYCRGCLIEHDQEQPISVKSYTKNPFQLYDTAGNVYEWVDNCWNADEVLLKISPETELGNTECNWRIIRGGSWTSKALSGFTSDRRLWTSPDHRALDLGFRLVREF